MVVPIKCMWHPYNCFWTSWGVQPFRVGVKPPDPRQIQPWFGVFASAFRSDLPFGVRHWGTPLLTSDLLCCGFDELVCAEYRDGSSYFHLLGTLFPRSFSPLAATPFTRVPSPPCSSPNPAKGPGKCCMLPQQVLMEPARAARQTHFSLFWGILVNTVRR